MNYFIYKTTNQINGKIYIGQKRAEGLAKTYLGSGIILQKALKKYGKQNFKREILEFCTEDTINEKEKYWIAHYNSTNKEIGYNISTGGGGGNGLCGELNGMFGKTGEQNPFFEKHHSEETKAILREKTSSAEHLTCPHCSKTMNIRNAKQYHFDNCIHNPNISEEGVKMWKTRFADLKKSRKKVVECPYCGKNGKAANMYRYHFEHCEEAPVLSKETINRIQSRELAKARKNKPKEIKQELVKCPYCEFESLSKANMTKWHFDNCKENPNRKVEIHKCIYCGIETENKANITRFHNENCSQKPNYCKYVIQTNDDTILNIGKVLKVGKRTDNRTYSVIKGYCKEIRVDWVKEISKEDYNKLEPRNKFVINTQTT